MTMAKSKVYDINIWVDDQQLRVIAYKLKIDANSYLTSDHGLDQAGEVFTRSMTNKTHHKAIGYLLDCPDWHLRSSWDGYDHWEYSDFLLRDKKAPKAILDWYESLPEYEIELVSTL